MHLINEDIKNREVNIITENGNKVVSKEEALKIAQEQNLDLVQLGKEKIPACKIMDYGKFKYTQKKKLKEQKQKNKEQKSKEVRFSLNISEHDIEHKIKHIKQFLSQGREVTLTLRLKGRNRGHTSAAKELMNGIILKLEKEAKIAKPLVADSNFFKVTLVKI